MQGIDPANGAGGSARACGITIASRNAGKQRRGALNIHHVELFYYVARHGGISRAVRNMPYGIQQPAVSSQILLLEEDLGVKLFERSPFKLTRAGEELYAFAQPFFENLHATAARLRQTAAPHLRVGASELVLRDYLPEVIEHLRMDEPKLRLGLRSGLQADMERWLLEREIDLAIVPLENKPTPRLRCQRLVSMPLVLQVHRKAKIKSADALWAQDPVEEPLICLPPTEVITKIFRQGLDRRKVDWPHSIEASSMGLVTRYVANGYGIGVSVEASETIKHKDVKVLPLDGFDPIEIVLLSNGEPTPMVQRVTALVQAIVARQWPESRSLR